MPSELLYSHGTLVLVTAGVFCAIVRWMHMCHPYDRNGDYFYPARRQVSFFYLLLLLQMPYVMNPMSEANWFYSKVFSIVYFPMAYASILRRYFRNQRLNSSLIRRVHVAVPLVFLVGVLLAILLIGEEEVLSHKWTIVNAAMVMSFLFTADYIWVAGKLRKIIYSYHRDNYSTSDDFPYAFARRVIYLPVLLVPPLWIVIIANSRGAKLGCDLFIALVYVLFLCMILHPQKGIKSQKVDDAFKELEHAEQEEMREMSEEHEAQQSTEETEAAAVDISTEERADIMDQLMQVVLNNFRNPHLKKSDILKEFEYGKKNIANQLISEIGYYAMINMFRLRYAELYQEANPDATQDMVAYKAGFTSRRTLNRTRQTITEVRPEVKSLVRLDP